MRPRVLAPLILLVALGCRPRGEVGPTPEPGDDPTVAPQPEGSDEAPALPDREPGTIFRSELIRATQAGNPPYLLAQLGPEPYSPQGRFEGWVITRVWPGDPELCAPGCDVRIGDIILSVNGSRLETPEQLSNLLSDLDAIDSIDVTGIRDGQFFERSYAVIAD